MVLVTNIIINSAASSIMVSGLTDIRYIAYLYFVCETKVSTIETVLGMGNLCCFASYQRRISDKFLFL